MHERSQLHQLFHFKLQKEILNHRSHLFRSRIERFQNESLETIRLCQENNDNLIRIYTETSIKLKG